MGQGIEVQRLGPGGAFLLRPSEFEDARGKFHKLYSREIMKRSGASFEFPEEYLSVSKKGVLRGLHYQLGEYSQAKLVRCVRGEIFDVIVDLRKSSMTFGKSVSAVLSETNMLALYAPRGFAHGFLSLTEGAEVIYKADNDYAPEQERGILWSDPALGVKWPEKNPILSEKDRKWPALRQAEVFE